VDSTYTDLFDLLSTNSYQKGGWVLHMLRGVVGDDAFFRGIRRYYREHMNGTAATSDLQAVMEAEAGIDLHTFFHQCLFQPGFPVLRGGWTWNSDLGEAVVTITQEQPDSWPDFHFDLMVELATSDGPVRATLPVRSRNETLTVPLSGPPTGLVLDPDGWLLKEVVRGGRP
jgi:aminopeptidase N